MFPLPLVLGCCAEVDELLSEYLDGELGSRSVARVEVHLVTCAACARLAADLAATVAALHGLSTGATRSRARARNATAPARTSRSGAARR